MILNAAIIFTIIAAWATMAWLLITNQQTQRKIMKTQQQLEADLKALTEQQRKIATEQAARFDAQTAAIRALEEQIRNGPVSEGVEAALAELQSTTQALDDTIPDAPPAG